jgi:N-methylhydantoinase A
MATDEAVRVGVDIGGTFTDIVTVRDGRVGVHKTPSTPDAPEEAVVTGLEEVAARGADGRESLALEDVGFLGHGTTVATNAVLEGEWAETALVTTEGFRDVLEIGRQTRPDLYDLHAEKPDPVVPRDRRFEVGGRIDERGRELEALDEAAVRDLAPALSDAESVAVSLLFPFEDDGHERRVRDLLREAGVDAAVSLSAEVLPEIREYERTLTTALNAALKPVMESYVGNLARDVREAGVRAPLKVMGSNGGVVTADAARERPVNTLLSGPAAGVRGATYVAGRRGVSDLVTMDMGGTSCDVSLVTDGEPLVATETDVGGYPVAVPAVDVHTVGAGGGSVAHVDAGGALRVGPASAGADPGPVCYGRGGTRPTTTDAHLLLGRIDPAAFGSDLDGAEADVRAAVEEHLADPLGTSVADAAAGVLEVANANMERALRVVSVERGFDPRSFTLVAYGGAGPLHAPALAAALDVPRVLVPRTAGVLSALGLLVSDSLYDHSASRVRPLADVDPATVEERFAALEARGRERLAEENHPVADREYERTADLRYVGQSFDLRVPVPDAVDEAALSTLAERFHDEHRRRYGHAAPGDPVELVTLRVRARGRVDPPDLAPGADAREGSLADARRGTRRVRFADERPETPVYDRPRLPVGASFDGPAVVEGPESTTVVRPGMAVTVDDDANLLVEVDA